VALLPGVRKRLSEKTGLRLVADEVGAIKLVREARMAGCWSEPLPGAPPDVVATIDGVPLVVRCRVPICHVYAIDPATIPAPTIDDRDLAISVARTINLA
jgi:hypothetical protein